MVLAIQWTTELVMGAVAFVTTAAYSALALPLLMKVIAKTTARCLLIMYFLCGIVMCVAWLIYLWPLENLFVRISIGLQLLANVVLLLQVILLRRRVGIQHRK